MDKVLYEKRNRIGYITLNRPDALNALDDELNGELWTVWEDFARDESLDVGILTGAGKAFCSGADLKTFIPQWEKRNMLDVRRNVPTGIGGVSVLFQRERQLEGKRRGWTQNRPQSTLNAMLDTRLMNGL